MASPNPSTHSQDSSDEFINSLNIDAIRSVALNAIRLSAPPDTDSDITCVVVEPARIGAYNIVYEVQFSSGVTWAIRIPYREWTSKGLRRTVIGQQYIASQTTVPVPKIHAYSFNGDNALGHPYIIMDYARGTRLADVWFDASWWTGLRSRARTLRSLAQHMVQLSSRKFATIGMLDRNDDHGTYFVAPFPSRFDWNDDVYGSDFELGPFDTQNAFLLALWNSQVAGRRNAAPLAAIGLFLGVLSDARYDSAPFTLGHPDFDSQNVFIDDETGDISSLIDWDRVSVLPRQLGALTYPAWLTVDWDPIMYDSYKDNGRYDHADELHNLRSLYTGFIKEFGGDACADVTRNSHIPSAMLCALSANHTTAQIALQLSKLYCGSAPLLQDIFLTMPDSIWAQAGPSDLIRMPEFIVTRELFGEGIEDGKGTDK